MKNWTFLIFLLVANLTFSQNPQGFDKMCKNYIKGTVPLAKPTQLKFEMSKNSSLYILDAREQSEYEISHIKGARFIGYDKFKIEVVKDIPKDAKVYVYCSIGYRSEKIGEKLQKDGFTNVYNLYGGIFNWANSGFPVENKNGQPTKKVHGYNKKWAKWLNEEKCEAKLD
ncbi:MAG: rhodanese-like domain-containing protein [Crocinitomicaceae bacterium]